MSLIKPDYRLLPSAKYLTRTTPPACTKSESTEIVVTGTALMLRFFPNSEFFRSRKIITINRIDFWCGVD
jgi:hypothetical protein